MPSSYFIAVDWGTTSMRAYLCKCSPDTNIQLIARSIGLGVSKLTESFEQSLLNCISPWEHEYGKLPIIMAGQIGSSIGWKETPYMHCPMSPSDVASNCTHFSYQGYDIHVVPGLSCELENQQFDVMRGEELQILGWLQSQAKHAVGEHLICLPGTHTKWVLVKDGKIERFKTAMTGELFDLLINHSVLIQEKHSEFNTEAFDLGVKFILDAEHDSFAHGLFSVRTKQLFGQLRAHDASSYLSGILIGSDVRAAMKATEWEWSSLQQIAIIGAPHLSRSFARALDLVSTPTDICKVTSTTLIGFYAIFEQLYRRGQ